MAAIKNIFAFCLAMQFVIAAFNVQSVAAHYGQSGEGQESAEELALTNKETTTQCSSQEDQYSEEWRKQQAKIQEQIQKQKQQIQKQQQQVQKQRKQLQKQQQKLEQQQDKLEQLEQQEQLQRQQCKQQQQLKQIKGGY